jgi:hypothetical protein
MPRPRRRTVLAAAVALAAALAPGTAQAQAGQDNGPAFSLATADGQTLVGPWLALGQRGTVLLAGDKTAVVRAGAWLTLRRAKTPLPPHPRGPQVVLAGGDRIPLEDKATIKIVDNQLHFQPAQNLQVARGPMIVPLSRVALIWLGGPDADADDPSRLLRRLLAEGRKRDLVVLRGGDRVDGSVAALDSGGECRIEVAKKQLDIPWASVGAVAFRTDLLVKVPPARPYYHLVLADGTRLSVLAPALVRGGALHFTTPYGVAVETAAEQVVTLEVRQGPAVYLSDLEPRKYEHTPFVGTSWPLVRDGSVTGGELRLAGSTFDKGLGMHAESRVVYDLAGGYRRFEALVGLDPEHGKKGRVHLRVLLDGKEADLGWKKELTAADGALALRVEVAKAKELTLEVLFGSTGDVQAHVNWAEARLVK